MSSTSGCIINNSIFSSRDLLSILPFYEVFSRDISFTSTGTTGSNISGTINLTLFTNTTNYIVLTSYEWTNGGSNNSTVYNASNSVKPAQIFNKTAGSFQWGVYRNNNSFTWTGKLHCLVIYY